MATETMNVGANLGPTIFTNFSGIVQADAYGGVTINSGDVTALLRAGAVMTVPKGGYYSVLAPAAANAALVVHSGSLSAGSLTISAQPAVMRPLQAIVLPGTLAITAGTLTLTYLANDQTTQVDTFQLATAVSTNLTLNTSKGVVTLTSAVVATTFAGGASPTIQIGTTAVLAVPLLPHSDSFVLNYEADDTTVTLGTGAGYGLVTPVNAPNATHNYTFGYSYVA